MQEVQNRSVPPNQHAFPVVTQVPAKEIGREQYREPGSIVINQTIEKKEISPFDQHFFFFFFTVQHS